MWGGGGGAEPKAGRVTDLPALDMAPEGRAQSSRDRSGRHAQPGPLTLQCARESLWLPFLPFHVLPHKLPSQETGEGGHCKKAESHPRQEAREDRLAGASSFPVRRVLSEHFSAKCTRVCRTCPPMGTEAVAELLREMERSRRRLLRSRC